MSCLKVPNCFVCTNVENFHEVVKPDGTSVWFEYGGMCGVWFWVDGDCSKDIEWWDDQYLVEYQYKWLEMNKGVKRFKDEDSL